MLSGAQRGGGRSIGFQLTEASKDLMLDAERGNGLRAADLRERSKEPPLRGGASESAPETAGESRADAPTQPASGKGIMGAVKSKSAMAAALPQASKSDARSRERDA